MTTQPIKRRRGEIWWEEGGGWNRDQQSHRVVFIEYHDRRPFNVVTENHWVHSGKPWFKPGVDRPNGTSACYWDFEWCKRDETLYYSQSGGGGDPRSIYIGRFTEPDPPPGLFWAAPDVRFHRWVSKAKPEVAIRSDSVLLAMGYRRLARPLLLKAAYHAGSDKRTRNPFLAAEELEGRIAYCMICDDHFPSDHECEHMEWCDRCACLVYIDGHIPEDSHDGKPVIHDETDDDD
jgi:hypothetical protein